MSQLAETPIFLTVLAVPGCSVSGQTFCVHCSPSGDFPLSCIADGTTSCYTTFKVQYLRCRTEFQQVN